MTTADDDLIRAHADMVFATCMRLTGNAQDAADVSQEVFISWMQQRGRIRGPVAAWLHGTARRRSLDWLRRHHRRSHHERQADTPAIATPSGDDGTWRTALDACLAKLDSRQRTLVIEHHLMGLSQESLATRWRLSQATVSRHLALAMERLRQGLVRHGVTAATVAAVSVALSDLKAEEPCPSGLTNPLLAHAQVQGAGALVWAGSLVVWWTTWPAIVAACLTGLLTLGAGGLLAWRAVIASNLPADPVASVIARLPAAPQVAQAPGTGAPRYRSIEALIDRLPAVDEARQARIRAWITKDGTSMPWAWLRISEAALTLDSKSTDPAGGMTTTATLAEADRIVIAASEPLLKELTDPSASLTEAGWLASDYRNGRIHWSGDALALINTRSSECKFLLHALGRQAQAADDPHDALTRLDRVDRSLHTNIISLLSALTAIGFDRARDDVYLRLAIQNRLGDSDLRRWCAEPPVANRCLEEALLGEPLLVALPRMEDVLRWGEAAMSPQWMVDDHASPGVGEWLSQPWFTGGMLEFVQISERVRTSLAGQERMTSIVHDAASAGVWTQITIPALEHASHTAAQARLAHAGKRLMAWLIADSRRGHPLPETLDEVVPVVADGQMLLGGGGLGYGLSYRKLSDTRFRLAVDPHSRLPAYGDAEGLLQLVQKSQPPSQATELAPPVVVLPAAWEADVRRLAEPAATNAVFPNEDLEPTPPQAMN